MKITITSAENGLTIKQYFAKMHLSARLITKLKAKSSGILVNSERRTVRYILSEGDVLELETEDSESSSGIPLSDIPISVLWEDEYYIAVDKPPHLPIHPSHRHLDDTLASRVMSHFKNRDFVFRVLTRLDLDTSGVVLIAKDSISASRLSELLVQRKVKKEYIAICSGIFSEKDGVIDLNIRRREQYKMEREAVAKGVGGGELSPEGVEAVSEYRVLLEGKNASLVSLLPVTGRTHQLRVHTRAIGHPIIGDTLYSEPSPYIDRQALHAACLTFVHPVKHEGVCIKSPLPEDILKCKKELFDE